MNSSLHRSLRRLALCGAYALGVFFIIASGGGGGGGGGQPTDSSCRLEVGALAPATDGSNDVWIGATSIFGSSNRSSVARLNADGSEQFLVDLGSGSGNFVRTVAVAVEGIHEDDLYVGGDFSEGIFRLGETGVLDSSFPLGSGFNGSVNRITPAADGSGDIFVTGEFDRYNSVLVGSLVRLASNGNLLVSFKTNAGQEVALAGAAIPGGVYSGGDDEAPPLALFTSLGAVIWNINTYDPVYSILAVNGGTRAYIGGGFTNRIVRLRNNSLEDGNFDVGAGFNGDVRKIIEADVGTDVYVVGGFTAYQSTTARGIIRLDEFGDPAAFNTGTGFTNPDSSIPFDDFASAGLSDDGSGDLYVGGDFLLYNSTARNGIVRLNSDGSPDPGFEVDISPLDITCNNETIPGL